MCRERASFRGQLRGAGHNILHYAFEQAAEGMTAMSRWFGSINLKVFLLVVLVIGLLVAFADFIFYRQVQSDLLDAAAEKARGVLIHVSKEMVLEGRWLPPQQLQRIIDTHTHVRRRMRAMGVYDLQGSPIVPLGMNTDFRPETNNQQDNQTISLVRLGREPLFAAIVPVSQGGHQIGSLVGLLWLGDLISQIKVMEKGFWWFGLSSWALLSLVLYGSLNWMVVSPIKRLESAATGLAQGQHQRRVQVNSRDELGSLEKTFNYMADSLTKTLSDIDNERKQLRTIIDTQGDCLFVVDAQCRVKMANRRFTDLLGIKEQDLTNHSCRDVLKSDLCQISCPLFNETNPAISEVGMEAQLYLPDGRTIPIRKNAKLIYGQDGKVVGGVETFRDISQEKELDRLRSEWEAFIRHELKNPLNPILALSGELRRPDYQMEHLGQDLELIHQNARKLARLLEQTREVQLYESGKLKLNLMPYDLVQTIQQAAVQAGKAVTAGQGVWKGPDEPAWRLRAEADLDAVILHDPENLGRALQNLMQNAWEHHLGEVTVQLSAPVEGWLRVVVHNQGEPIPPQRLATIFEKYNTTKQDLGGSGLGTTIAKVLVEAHGGTISASSSWERGTEFTINLPRGSREV